MFCVCVFVFRSVRFSFYSFDNNDDANDDDDGDDENNNIENRSNNPQFSTQFISVTLLPIFCIHNIIEKTRFV